MREIKDIFSKTLFVSPNSDHPKPPRFHVTIQVLKFVEIKRMRERGGTFEVVKSGRKEGCKQALIKS